MDPERRAARARRIIALFSTLVVCLAATMASGCMAQLHLVQADAWIVFDIGTVLTFVLAVLTSIVMNKQRRSLALAHEEAAHQRALLGAIIEHVDDGIVAVDASLCTVAMNAVARTMVGNQYPRDGVPNDWRYAITVNYEDGSTMEPKDGPLVRATRGESTDDLVYRIVPAGKMPDEGIWVSATARPIHDANGRIVAAVATLRNITEQRASVERLRDLSLTDELTGLLNRRGFIHAANIEVSAARRTGSPLALLYADVNGLKRVNDELGHKQGDHVLTDAARVLRRVCRDGDVVARIGGDEFVALLPNLAPSAGDALLERLAEAIRAHGEGEDRPYRLSMSAGVTFLDHAQCQSLDELLADADRCMYERKRTRQSVAPRATS